MITRSDVMRRIHSTRALLTSAVSSRNTEAHTIGDLTPALQSKSYREALRMIRAQPIGAKEEMPGCPYLKNEANTQHPETYDHRPWSG